MTQSTAKKNTVLLVNPHIEDFAAYDHFSKPLGLLRLASYLKDHCNVYFLNALDRLHPSAGKLKFNADGTGEFIKTYIPKPGTLKDIPRRFKRYGLPDDAFLRELKKLPEAPELVFVTSAITYWYTGIQHTISLIREVFPKAKILLGGVYAALLPGHARKNTGADMIVPYQDTGACLDALEDLLGWKFDHGYRDPDYGLLKEYYYLPVMTSSGCVFKCGYCASPALSVFEQYDPHRIAGMIAGLHEQYHVNRFAFYDDALLFQSEKHIDVILECLIRKKVRAEFYTPNGLHIRYLTPVTAMLMKSAGFADIRLSLESADPDFQKKAGKTANADFEKALNCLFSAGFERRQIKVYTLLNIPGQDPASVEKTMDYISGQGTTPMLAFYSPIPGTPDFANAAKTADLQEPLYQNNTVYLYRSGFDLDYLHRLKMKEKQYRNS